MEVRSNFISFLHLDSNYSLLSSRAISVVLEYFKKLDIFEKMALDDVQFYAFMRSATDLSKEKIYKVFDLLDVDRSGLMDFDEFYLLICILVAMNDRQEKQFINHHSRSVFDLLDVDGSNSVSADEFESYGFLFGFNRAAVRHIFKEFDVSGDQELDYQEFKMFAMACIEHQIEMENRSTLGSSLIGLLTDYCCIC